MKNKIIIGATILLLSAFLVTSCNALTSEAKSTSVPTPVSDPGVIAEANFVPADQSTLVFTVPGRVSEILVEEGDRVESGEVLARLENVESLEMKVSSADLAVLEAEQNINELKEKANLVYTQAQVELIQAKQELINAERAWDEVDTDEFQEDLDDARIEMNDAEDDLEDAEEDLDEHEDLDEDNPIRERYEEDVEDAQQEYDEAKWAFNDLQNEYDLVKAQLEAAQAALNDAEQRVEDTRDGPDPDELALANASLDQAKALLSAAESALADAELTAPFAGKVVRLELVEGAQVSAGAMAMILIDDSEWFVETNDLTEDEIVGIEEGDEVSISFDALPDKTFTGEVESISDYFVEQYGDITYVVRIRLGDLDDRLRWGMTAEVKFPETSW
jgi:multidrug resistance efflux pump